jgi:branched-subunit amino acid aminotransferase/4-amino-4-deoxychorismate lyase
MANFDVNADTTPVLSNKKADTKPTISALRTAIAGSDVTASYPSAFLDGATKDDLIYVCKTHGISVVGL